MTEQTHYRACNLCEAICGLEIRTDGAQILSIKGDKDDPFSRGHICPKATALQDIQTDPDRLTKPVKRVGDKWTEISWEEAFEEVADKLWDIQQEHGRDAVGIYLGNPSVHNYGMVTHGRNFFKLLKTKNRFSATSVDQLPHQLISYLMYGHQFTIPVPDIDQTDFFLVLGGNPLVSNGSMMTVPNMKNRLKALRARGGKMVIIDPRRTESAEVADLHHFIRPGTDAAFLLAFLNILFEENLINIVRFKNQLQDFDKLVPLIKDFTAAKAADITGIPESDIRALVRDFARADKAACYGRMGVSTNPYGTLCHWLIQLINIATNNLDRVGGTLVPLPALDFVGMGLMGAGGYGRWKSRVSGRPEACGELSATVMAEEILTPGDGQIRAMFTGAGNPVLSTPNGRQLDRAFEKLDFMVSLDFYINETTRHADIILPPTPALEHDHYDLSFFALAVRNVTRMNEPVFEKPPGTLHDWEIFDGLAEKFMIKQGITSFPKNHAPAQLINIGLAYGPYGYKGKHPDALSLAKLKQSPHGIDLGPLKPRLPKALKINCLPDLLKEDLKRVHDLFDRPASQGLLLIGRRDIRTNNSWMHNFKRLVKGKERCTLLIHPKDCKSHNFEDGQTITIKSRVGEEKVMLEKTEKIMPGTVSLPHGWGHNRKGMKMDIAADHPGVSVNDLTDEKLIDQLAGTAAINGVPVELY